MKTKKIKTPKLKTKRHNKIRLYGKRIVKLPYPITGKKDKGFRLRQITEADNRFAVVKTMKQRLKQLIEDADITSIQSEWLAARAVFIVGYLESLEVDALDGKQIDWTKYLQATRSLTDVLNKLGLDKVLKSAQRLENYVANYNDEQLKIRK